MAEYSGTGQGFLEALLTTLALTTGPSDPTAKRTPVGFLDTIASQRFGGVQGADLGNGHERSVRVKYLSRACESEVRTTKECLIPAHEPYKEVSFTPSKHLEIDVTVDRNIVQLYESEASSIAQMLFRNPPLNTGAIPDTQGLKILKELAFRMKLKMNALKTKMDRELLLTLLGYLPTPDTGIAYDSASGAPIAQFFVELIHSLHAYEFMGAPNIAGSGNFDKFSIGSEHTAVDGGNLMRFRERMGGGYNFALDNILPVVFGDPNALLIWEPGALQLVTLNAYRGGFEGEQLTYATTTMPDPETPGLFWDIKYRQDECSEKDIITIGLKAYDLFVIPADAYNACDGLTGYQGFRYWQALAA